MAEAVRAEFEVVSCVGTVAVPGYLRQPNKSTPAAANCNGTKVVLGDQKKVSIVLLCDVRGLFKLVAKEEASGKITMSIPVDDSIASYNVAAPDCHEVVTKDGRSFSLKLQDSQRRVEIFSRMVASITNCNNNLVDNDQVLPRQSNCMDEASQSQMLAVLRAAVECGDLCKAQQAASVLAILRVKCVSQQQLFLIPRPEERNDQEICIFVTVEDKLGTKVGPILFSVMPDKTVGELKCQFEERYQIPAESQTWINGFEFLKDTDTLKQKGITKSGDIVYIYHSRVKKRKDRKLPIYAPPDKTFETAENGILESNQVAQTVTVAAAAGWGCPRCTYLNEPTRPGCEMCSGARPEHYRVPENYQPSDAERQRMEKEMESEEGWQRRALQEEEERLQNYEELLKVEGQEKVIDNREEFHCSICFDDIPAGDGVVLRECGHSFCKDCLSGHIQACEDAQVMCPHKDDSHACQMLLQDREIQQLVSEDVYNRYLRMGLASAENRASDSFHCMTPDCQGFCFYEDDINEFACPVCLKTNCITCKAIHEEQNCKEYQDEVKANADKDENARKTATMLEVLLESKEAMKCPKCGVVVQKKSGCDWLVCRYCATEICWVTHGPRWGPKGHGDTSAGCKCKVNGPCHPRCGNCH